MTTLFLTLILWLQTQPTVPVTLQVRYLNGSAFNHPIHIRSDEGELLQTCEPDELGRCTVQVQRGLYLIEPTDTQLDAVSAAAAVEIGGRWLAITVGDDAISYSFVIDEDAVYFDNTPDETFPRPIRPNQADIEAHFETVEETLETESATQSAENTPTENDSSDPSHSAEEDAVSDSTENQTPPAPMSEPTTSSPTTNFAWRWVILPLVIFSILIGWLWWHTRRRQTT